jgi:hypothetical protein
MGSERLTDARNSNGERATESPFPSRESIVVLREGEQAPEGKVIARVLSESAELVGPGTNYRRVYTVAVRDAALELRQTRACPHTSKCSANGCSGLCDEPVTSRMAK